MNEAEQRARAEAEIQRSLVEKEQLLREVHHRVKNNLQLIISLINLQAGQLEDPRVLNLFQEMRNRVYSIAAIHDLIYRSASFTAIELAEYARHLVPELVRFYGADKHVTVEVLGDGVTLELERAVPFGLLLNELVSNTCKHAFPGRRQGALKLAFSRQDDRIVLEVSDTGVGMPAGFLSGEASSLGMQLVRSLALQLEGELAFGSGPGTTVHLKIPARAGSAAESAQ